MKKQFAIVGLACLLATGAALAQSKMEIGRVTLNLAEPGWEKLDATAADLNFASVQGKMQVEAGLAVFPGADGQVDAAILLLGTRGAGRGVNWGFECKTNPKVFVRDYTDGKPYIAECLWGGGSTKSEPMLENGALKRLGAAMKPLGKSFPVSGYFTRVFIGSTNGSLIEAEVFLAKNFAGLPDKQPSTSVPDKLPPAVAAWMEAFGASAKDALYSFSGTMTVPPVTFAAK